MRIEEIQYWRNFLDGFRAGLLTAVAIFIICSLLFSCATYPLQQKVIKPTHNAKAVSR